MPAASAPAAAAGCAPLKPNVFSGTTSWLGASKLSQGKAAFTSQASVATEPKAAHFASAPAAAASAGCALHKRKGKAAVPDGSGSPFHTACGHGFWTSRVLKKGGKKEGKWSEYTHAPVHEPICAGP